MENIFVDSLDDTIRCLQDRSETFVEPAARCARLTEETLRMGGKIFFCGNGGSASTASHLANDLSCHMKNWQREGYRCICLNDSAAAMSSLANDYGFECVFSKPVQALGDAGDILWAFSTSGNSKNVVHAVEVARAKGMKTAAFTGRGGGKLKDICDVWVSVNSDEVVRVEELHLLYGHGIALCVEAAVSPME